MRCFASFFNVMFLVSICYIRICWFIIACVYIPIATKYALYPPLGWDYPKDPDASAGAYVQ